MELLAGGTLAIEGVSGECCLRNTQLTFGALRRQGAQASFAARMAALVSSAPISATLAISSFVAGFSTLNTLLSFAPIHSPLTYPCRHIIEQRRLSQARKTPTRSNRPYLNTEQCICGNRTEVDTPAGQKPPGMSPQGHGVVSVQYWGVDRLVIRARPCLYAHHRHAHQSEAQGRQP